jgi:hypothetical protein
MEQADGLRIEHLYYVAKSMLVDLQSFSNQRFNEAENEVNVDTHGGGAPM